MHTSPETSNSPPTDAVVAQWQSTPLVRVRSRVQSSLTAPSAPIPETPTVPRPTQRSRPTGTRRAPCVREFNPLSQHHPPQSPKLRRYPDRPSGLDVRARDAHPACESSILSHSTIRPDLEASYSVRLGRFDVRPRVLFGRSKRGGWRSWNRKSIVLRPTGWKSGPFGTSVDETVLGQCRAKPIDARRGNWHLLA